MSRLVKIAGAAWVVVACVACGGGTTEGPDMGTTTDAASDAARADAGSAGDGGAQSDGGGCVSMTDCQDGLFCNGEERCMQGACVAATSPACAAPRTCSEAQDRCMDQCVDTDGDGACVPDDCDDTNSRVYPGATERCDAANLDEDCNPTTYGAIDEDSDGYNAARCCNVDTAGVRTCGNDCDDQRATANPGTAETCDTQSIDNDCDPATTDEMLLLSCYPDVDRDTFAPMGSTAVRACRCTDMQTSRAPAAMIFDCNDNDPAINSLAIETCAPGDLDCNGSDDPPGGCGCVAGTTVDCGSSPPQPGMPATSCQPRTVACPANGQISCPADSVFPLPGAESLCNNIDDDCDGQTDEGITKLTCYPDTDGDSYAVDGAVSQLLCPVNGICPARFTTRAPMTGVPTTIDCNDSAAGAAVNPVATDLCSTTIDEDCDGVGQEGQISCYADADNDGYAALNATLMNVCPDPVRVAVGRCPNNFTNRMPVTNMFATYDCNDSTGSVSPAAPEECTTAADEDCSCGGATSPSTCGMPGATTCYRDADGDGYAAIGAMTFMGSCGMCPPGSVLRQPNMADVSTFDCDDSVATGAPRRQPVRCFSDTDNDGFPNNVIEVIRCQDLTRAARGYCDSGYVGNAVTQIDCAPSDGNAWQILGCRRDADGDGYGVATPDGCYGAGCPAGFLLGAPTTDCCDSDANANPGQTQRFTTARNGCGGYDYNCNNVAEPGNTRVSTRTCECNAGSNCPSCAGAGLTGWAGSVPGCGVTAPVTTTTCLRKCELPCGATAPRYCEQGTTDQTQSCR